MQTISIVTPCYNEAENVEQLYQAIRREMSAFPQYKYEVIFIDNCSQDSTVEKLKSLVAQDRHVKAIVNTRNFGHIRSPYYGILQASGDAVILMASDLQDPPEMIPQFLEAWGAGSKIVAAIKNESEESAIFFMARKIYYTIVSSLSDVDLLKNFTGFGLYDKVVIKHLREMDDPYPYFRGQISELGFSVKKISFVQPTRKRGFSKNNFYTLYDIAMLGFTNHTKIPLRLASMFGFGMSVICFTVAIAYFVVKLLYWDTFQLGLAPLVIGLFFTASIQLLFIGVIGEYIGAILTKVTNRPLVIEGERINF